MENVSKLETHAMEELKRDPKSIRKNQRQALSDFWQKCCKDSKKIDVKLLKIWVSAKNGKAVSVEREFVLW